jgi:hypothetical protein
VRVEQFPWRFSGINAQRYWTGRNVSLGDYKLKVEKGDSRDGEQRQSQFSIHLFRTSFDWE